MAEPTPSSDEPKEDSPRQQLAREWVKRCKALTAVGVVLGIAGVIRFFSWGNGAFSLGVAVASLAAGLFGMAEMKRELRAKQPPIRR